MIRATVIPVRISGEQLHRALNDFFAERKYDLFTVIQTPGTSLLGEALEPELDEISSEFQIPHLFIESPAFSENSMIGYDETTVRLMELLCDRTSSGNKDTATPRVNLFGFDSHEKFPEGGLKEITRLLKLCGIEVHTAVGINCPVSDFRTTEDRRFSFCCITKIFGETAASHAMCNVVESPGAVFFNVI